MAEIGAGDLHQPDRVTAILCCQATENLLCISPAGWQVRNNVLIAERGAGLRDNLSDGIRVKTGFHPCHVECRGRMNAGGALHGYRQKGCGGKHGDLSKQVTCRVC